MSAPNTAGQQPERTTHRTHLRLVEPSGEWTVDELFGQYSRLHPSAREPGTVSPEQLYGAGTPQRQLEAILQALQRTYPDAGNVDARKMTYGFDTLSQKEVWASGQKIRMGRAIGDISVTAQLLEAHAADQRYHAVAAVVAQLAAVDMHRTSEQRKIGPSGILRLGNLTMYSVDPAGYEADITAALRGELANGLQGE